MQLALDNKVPFTQISFRQIKTKAVEDKLIETTLMEHARNLVDCRGVYHRNNRTQLNVGEQRYFLALTLFDLDFRPAQQYIGLQTNRAHLFYRVLGWLGFGFTRRGNVWHQCQVHQNRSLMPKLNFKLANGFKEWLRFNITHRTANFDHSNIGTGRTGIDTALNFIG